MDSKTACVQKAQETLQIIDRGYYTALYPTLTKFQREMYEYNRSLNTYLYSDCMIYSPDVVFFKNDVGELLSQPFLLYI